MLHEYTTCRAMVWCSAVGVCVPYVIADAQKHTRTLQEFQEYALQIV